MTVSNPALKPTMSGQISRIRLENFMTYDSIEIKPGYHLNLIIGPNGTGKSSIVCAVVLGLGGKLKTLGRGDQLSSYIKSGCDQSVIEIELYNGKESVVIQRQISSNNQSQFYINNATATVTKINEIRKEFNIQIDNLCTFLPQEKVQDFAKLNPQMLLEQTERTVGSGDMIQNHEDLKRLRGSILESEKYLATLVEQHESEVQKNARIEDKVNSIREKQSLNDRLTLLNQKRAWLCYEEEISRKKEIDEDCKLAQKAFDDKRKKIDQVTRELKNLEDNIKDFQQKLTESKRDEAGKKAVVDDRLKRAQRRIDSLEDLDNVIQSRIAEEETKKQEMRTYEANVDKLENDLKNLLAQIGPEDRFNQQEAQISRELNAVHGEERQLAQSKADLEEDEMRLMQEARNASSERQMLERRRNQRLEFLRRQEPDIYKGMQWLKENEGIFRGKIYNPMLLELDVPDPQMAKFVEARISYRDLISFTCTNPEDLNLLIKKLRTEMHLRVNAVCSDEEDCTQYSPDVPMSQLRKFGFYAFLQDLVTGPEPIIRFLCKSYRIHTIPVGDESVNPKCDQVPTNINVFYSADRVFTVRFSAYTGDKSTSSRKIGEPRFFSASVDERRIRNLAEMEENIKQTIQMKQQEINEINTRIAGLKVKVEEIKSRKKSLATRAEEKNRINLNLKRARAQVDSIRRTMKDPAAIYTEAEKERENFRKQIERSLSDLKEANENLGKTIEKRREAEIIYKTSRYGIDELMESKQRLADEVRRAQETVSQMKERQRAAAAQCNQLKETARKATNGVGVGDKGFKKYEDKFKELANSLDELEQEIEDTQARADFLRGGNNDLLKEYEHREEVIAHLATTIETSKKDLEKKNEKSISLRDGWLNPVTDLVGKINTSFENFFETMGCAGEVVLVTPNNEDDYDQYGIKIRVKFRDEVQLQDLSRHFQSGGERAVATAIYMLSLQELTSVPFRFVDEINQGMDPANERRIIDLIVKVTAPVESAQYFFITPKLLPNIQCTKTMSVLCIYNGPTAIPSAKWSLEKFLKRAKATKENVQNGIDADEEEY